VVLSRSQVDRIGEKLRRGEVDAETLTKLGEYQLEFDPAYKFVERVLTKRLFLNITGRPAKSTLSIIEKLRRIRSRLSQIQDISGCRTIVHNLDAQDEVILRAREWFPAVEIDDKREEPTHGYRAVHLLVMRDGKYVEVQVRTRLQHFWATISEKLSDTYGQEIKYGAGDADVLSSLSDLSEKAREFDLMVNRLNALQYEERNLKRAVGRSSVRSDLRKRISSQQQRIRHIMYDTRRILARFDEMEKVRVLSD